MHKNRKLFVLFIALIALVLPLNAEAPSANIHENSDGLPNVSARLRPDSRDFYIYASLIFWTVKEAGADYWAEVITSNHSTSSNDIKEVYFGWDPGFRVGVGYGMKHDQWDTQFYYTWFRSHGKSKISSGPGTVYSTFLGNFYVDNANGSGLSGPSYQKASIDWVIHLNMFDWILGRRFWVSSSLLLAPFLGLKGGWIHQSICSKWQNPALSEDKFFNLGIEKLKNNFWGIGPEIGINTKWILVTNQNQLYLFGDFSSALMWGHWSFKDVFKNNLQHQVLVGLQGINSGASMIRTFMGLGWDFTLNQDRYRLSTKLGYEMQFWLDQLQFYSFTGGRLENQLTLQGGSLEFCFNF